MRRQPFTISRRRLLVSTGLASASLAMPAIWTSASASNRQLFVRDPGGHFSKAYGEAFYEPFKKETGIEVIGVISNADASSQVKCMVDTKTYTWDIVNLQMALVLQLLREGNYLEKHGLDNDPVVMEIPPENRSEYAVGCDIYTTALGYRTDTFKNNPPRSWRDFYDVENFKGRRAARKHPNDTIEIALMADEVPTDKVYPCDFDRAFKSLDRLKPNVAAWWTSGAQSTQMLVSGEVDMIATWSNRIQAAIDQGAPVAIAWDQNIWGLNTWAILKGTPKFEIAREFIRFASDAKRQAAMAPYLVNGPANPNTFKYIDEARAKELTTYPAYKAKGLAINDEFWAANKDKAFERFNDWLLR